METTHAIRCARIIMILIQSFKHVNGSRKCVIFCKMPSIRKYAIHYLWNPPRDRSRV